MGSNKEVVRVRPATGADLPEIIALDAEITRLAKPEYWAAQFALYGAVGGQRFFLVAECGGRVEGFILGEVRAWEFGSAPSGWIFAIQVRPKTRLAGVGTRLLDAVCAAFRAAGVTEVRTMVARDNRSVLSFFRSQGMMAGPFIQLELRLE